MTRRDINEMVVSSRIVDKVSRRFISIVGDSNIDDFVQEMYIMFLDLPDDRVFELYMNEQLDFYLISIIRNQAYNKHSVYNKKYSFREEYIGDMSDYVAGKNMYSYYDFEEDYK